MTTDPYVAAKLEDRARHQQNMPRGVHVPPAKRWVADRPGDVGAESPSGGLLGNPGPNIGYALTLVKRVADRLQLAPGEHLADAAAVVAELAMRRSAFHGRAPVLADVELAAALFGYDGPAELTEWRAHVVHHAAHDYPTRRRVVDAVPGAAIHTPAAELANHLAEIREGLRAAFTQH